MCDIVVRIGGRPDPEIVRINVPEPNFMIAVENAENRLLEMAGDLLLDLLDIAGAVFSIDGSIRRGGGVRTDFGSAWRRELHFDIPVRTLSVWRQAPVREALTDLVSFVTEDVVSFAFGNRDHEERRRLQPSLFPDDYVDVETVVLFSGGLDSLAGAMEILATSTGRIALVTHRSAQKIYTRQNGLAAALQRRFPGRVIYVPINAHRVEDDAVETTQRSRSVLFLALGYLVARMLKARRIVFFENGVVSMNLPISPQVVGSMATRTTHPWTMELMRRFLETLGGDLISIDSPFAWLTKTEVLQRLASAGGSDLIKYTVSCSHVRDRTLMTPHCGECSQCLDRRFAVLAAGLDEHDPVEAYETRLFSDPRKSDRACTLALEWCRKSVALAGLNEQTFVEAHAGELQRIILGNPGRTASEVARQSFEMQKRHGEQVQRALARATSEFAARIAAGDLPPNSLLGMFINWRTQMPAEISRSHQPEVIIAEETHDEAIGVFPLHVTFFETPRGKAIDIRRLGAIHAPLADVPHALKPYYVLDLADRLEPAAYRYTLAPAGLPISKDSFRTNVLRIRRQLASFCDALELDPPAGPILIQNKPGHGYRLDPACRIMESRGSGT